jgi:hypothetical protein
VSLPKTGPVDTFAQSRAALDKTAFLAALGGVAAFVRLDERGGDDEPAPWAFHNSGLSLPIDIPSTDEDVFVDASAEPSSPKPRGSDDSTLTGPTFQLSIPAARGRATMFIVPKAREVMLGRSSSCDIAVRERSVSKQHALLVIDGARFTIVDLGSHNGISVNGKRTVAKGKTPLSSGDVLELGDVSLLFLDAADLWDGLPRLASG